MDRVAGVNGARGHAISRNVKTLSIRLVIDRQTVDPTVDSTVD
jgi:hypothetical protein